jgi:hypothetical protein
VILLSVVLLAGLAAWVLMSWARTAAAVGVVGVMVTHPAPAPAAAAVLAVLFTVAAVVIFCGSLRATGGRLMTSTYPIGGSPQ